jgi:ubiquinol-cytochrome c reductase cytochrome b subunit
VFWPGVVMPLVTFAVVIAWPWIDKRLTRDTAPHDVLVPPTAAPWRVGVGAALLSAGVVLTLAASDDTQALAFHVPVQRLVWLYRILLPVGSIGIGFLAATVAREIAVRRKLHGEEVERVVALRRNAQGGFDDEEVQPA